MAVSTITYSDKVTLNENSSVADINKGRAVDWNEIKTVVNNNATETSTNTTDIANLHDDIYYKSGDTFQWLQSEHSDYELYNQITVGHITGGAQNIQFTIELPKKLDEINSITLSSLAITVRTASGGYVFQDSELDLIGSSYTTRVYKRTGNILLINIERSSGSFGTNNSLVDVAVRNIIATFS